MLPTIAQAYHHAQGHQDDNAYAAWAAAVRSLKNDWEQGTHSETIQLQDYLKAVPSDQQLEALQDLISAHMILAWQNGAGTKLESYFLNLRDEFSEFSSSKNIPADLVEDEFLARYILPYGDLPLLSEYRERFPNRPDIMKLLEQRFLDDGRYVKLNQCGRGAMGEVFAAYDHHLHRIVAIKQPREHVLSNDDLLFRFSEEARITAGLEHPAIVILHEHCVNGERPFYVMRFVEGESFDKIILDYHQPLVEQSSSERRLQWHQLLQTFATLCDAISFAHRHSVLHRDLKPANIILGQFGEVSILDWGMAKEFASPESTHQFSDDVAGTPHYMPPEQTEGKADVRSDVFGLGAILYEILTAHSPHSLPEGSLPANWIDIVREANIIPPRKLKTGLPGSLQAICLKALSLNPEDRYQSASELSSDIHNYLVGEPVSVYKGSVFTRIWHLFSGHSI